MEDTRAEIIALASAGHIELSPDDFEMIDGDWTLDGMDPAEWVEAMTMD